MLYFIHFQKVVHKKTDGCIHVDIPRKPEQEGEMLIRSRGSGIVLPMTTKMSVKCSRRGGLFFAPEPLYYSALKSDRRRGGHQ